MASGLFMMTLLMGGDLWLFSHWPPQEAEVFGGLLIR